MYAFLGWSFSNACVNYFRSFKTHIFEWIIHKSWGFKNTQVTNYFVGYCKVAWNNNFSSPTATIFIERSLVVHVCMSRKELVLLAPGGLLLYGLLGWCVVCDWSEQTSLWLVGMNWLCSAGPWKGQPIALRRCLVGALKRAAPLLVLVFSEALKRGAVWPM